MSDTDVAFDATQVSVPPPSEHTSSSLDPWLGKTLDGKYEVLELLGEGGMGSVYRGVHSRIGRKVAIKLLHPVVARSHRAQIRFEGEARAAASTGHPNIIDVLDLGDLPDGSVYLVLELLDGRDLNHELRALGTMPVRRAIHIIRQVCAALTAVHAEGIVHRDLKPANIFLTEHLGDPDFVKVLDFGVAKFTQPQVGQATPSTRTGQPIGTPVYMSPEQARGLREVDHRTDVYAMGAVLFEALTGRCPFEATSLPGLVYQICHGEIPRLADHRPDLPEALEQVVAKMLERDVDLRFASADAVAAALEPFERYESSGSAVLESRETLLGAHDAPTPGPDSGAPTDDPSEADEDAGVETAEEATESMPPEPNPSEPNPSEERPDGSDPLGAAVVPQSSWMKPAAAIAALLAAAVGLAAWGLGDDAPTPPDPNADATLADAVEETSANPPEPSSPPEPQPAVVDPPTEAVRAPEATEVPAVEAPEPASEPPPEPGQVRVRRHPRHPADAPAVTGSTPQDPPPEEAPEADVPEPAVVEPAPEEPPVAPPPEPETVVRPVQERRPLTEI